MKKSETIREKRKFRINFIGNFYKFLELFEKISERFRINFEKIWEKFGENLKNNFKEFPGTISVAFGVIFEKYF